MEKYKDKILDYLSGKLSGKDKSEFENELNVSKPLADKFEKIKTELEELKLINDNIKVDERYFSTVVPRMHKRISEKKRTTRIMGASFSGAAVISAAIILFFIFSPINKSLDFSVIEYYDEIVNNLSSSDDELLSEIISDYESLVYNETNLFEEEVSQNLNLESSEHISYFNENKILELSYSYDSFDLLSDDEFLSIYNQLKTKIIL